MVGKISAPYIPGLDKMKPANRKQMIATEIQYSKLEGGIGLTVLGLTINNGENCQGGLSPIEKKRKLPADIKKIEVIFQLSEVFIFQIRFFCRDGSKFKIGGTDYWNAGRVETFNFADDEVLLGCEFDHTEKYTVGVTWIKWCPA